MTDRPRLFVIDGYGQIYRSYYAFMNRPLLDSEGNNVSAVFGFFTTLFSLIKTYNPEYIAVAMDSKGKTFRHEMFPEYKANRAKTPEDLHAQISVIDSILDSMNICHFERIGMEADDIIATLAEHATQEGIDTVMVTGDKDLLQLVNDTVFALRPPRGGEHEWRLCKEAEVVELFGVKPCQITDYLTILGDSSDNVPGIAGIGEKGAVKLLNQWESLENAYKNIDSLAGAIKTKLLASQDSVPLSHKLIELKNDVLSLEESDPLKCETSAIDWGKGVEAFTRLGSTKLAATARHFLPKDYVFTKNAEKKEEKKEYGDIVAEDVDLDNPKALVGFDLKEKIKALRADGEDPDAAFDIGVAAWMLDSNSGDYSLKTLTEKYVGEDVLELELSADDNVKKLYTILKNKLQEQNLYKLFTELEMPLCKVLADMETEGILLDCEKLSSFEKDLSSETEAIADSVFEHCGHPFNLNSPKQLQEVLFVERNLPTVKKTKSGFSTDSDVLEELSYTTEDPVPGLILRYRALDKLRSTYVSTLPSLLSKDGRIHTSFLQTGTATGRLSSKNPNLQNIPIRTEEGRRIRSAFEAKPGCVLISADYSQIELAVLAHLSQDPELCRAFREGNDVHRETAALIFDVFPDFVTPEQRRIAKTINFGVIYGMSAFRLGKDLKITRTQAQSFIDTYYAKYEKIGKFMEETVEFAKKNGYVVTEMGHRREVPEVRSVNKNIASLGERIAVNTVVQGTAAEIVKRAMISVYNTIKKDCLNSRILLQVHDEIILEVPQNEVEVVKKMLKTCMEGAAGLSVPLKVGIESSVFWGEMH